MPNIQWMGNRPWDTDFPETPMPEHAHALLRPENIFKASLPYGIAPLAVCYFLIFVKWVWLGEMEAHPAYMPLGILLGLGLIPVHEYLHALCYPKDCTVYVGICLEKCAAFAVCHAPISRRRFIGMSLAPVLLGVIPLAIFLLAPPSALLSGICIPSGIIGMLSPMPDYMDVHLVCRQVPRNGTIHTSNQGFYWY